MAMWLEWHGIFVLCISVTKSGKGHPCSASLRLRWFGCAVRILQCSGGSEEVRSGQVQLDRVSEARWSSHVLPVTWNFVEWSTHTCMEKTMFLIGKSNHWTPWAMASIEPWKITTGIQRVWDLEGGMTHGHLSSCKYISKKYIELLNLINCKNRQTHPSCRYYNKIYANPSLY